MSTTPNQKKMLLRCFPFPANARSVSSNASAPVLASANLSAVLPPRCRQTIYRAVAAICAGKVTGDINTTGCVGHAQLSRWLLPRSAHSKRTRTGRGHYVASNDTTQIEMAKLTALATGELCLKVAEGGCFNITPERPRAAQENSDPSQ